MRPRCIDSRTHAVITCAGPVAELRYAGLQGRDDWGEPTDDDLDAGAVVSLVHMGFFAEEMSTATTPVQPLLRSCEKAVLIIRDNWDAVGRIATGLLSASRALTYRECVELASD